MFPLFYFSSLCIFSSCRPFFSLHQPSSSTDALTASSASSSYSPSLFSHPSCRKACPSVYFGWGGAHHAREPIGHRPPHTSTHGVREGNLQKKALRLEWITFDFSFTFLGCSFLRKRRIIDVTGMPRSLFKS